MSQEEFGGQAEKNDGTPSAGGGRGREPMPPSEGGGWGEGSDGRSASGGLRRSGSGAHDARWPKTGDGRGENSMEARIRAMLLSTAQRTEAGIAFRARAKATARRPSEEAGRCFGDAAMPEKLPGWIRDAMARLRGVGRALARTADEGSPARPKAHGRDAFAEGTFRAVPRHGRLPTETWRTSALAEGRLQEFAQRYVMKVITVGSIDLRWE